jgi:hypothetical protein
MTTNEYPLIKNASKLVLEVVDLYFENKTYPDAFTSQDLLYAVMTLKALIKNFETITLGEIEKSMQYIH